VVMFGAANAPVGWLICDGTSYSTSAYPDLFNAIATNYNLSGDAAGTFRVPNLAARVPLGIGSGTDPITGKGFTLGATSGEISHALQPAENAIHTHTLTASQAAHSHTDNGHSHQVGPHGHAWNDSGHAQYIQAHGHGWTDNNHQHVIAGYSMQFQGLLVSQGGNQGYSINGGSNLCWTGGENQVVGSVQNAAAFWSGGPNQAVGSVANAAAFASANGFASLTTSQPAITATAANQGSGTGHNNLPPYLVMQYIIKT